MCDIDTLLLFCNLAIVSFHQLDTSSRNTLESTALEQESQGLSKINMHFQSKTGILVNHSLGIFIFQIKILSKYVKYVNLCKTEHTQ